MHPVLTLIEHLTAQRLGAASRVAADFFGGDEVALADFRRQLRRLDRYVCLEQRAEAAALSNRLLRQLLAAARLLAAPPPRPFDAHAFAAFDRAYCTLATPFESLVEGYALVLAFALTDPLTHPPAVLLEDKRAQPKPPDQRNEPVEEAEELVGWQFVSPQVEALAAEATDRGLPRLAVLAQWMAASALTQVPLPHGPVPHGPVPHGYFAVTAEVTFAVGLRLRHVHPALSAELAEELFRHHRRRAKLGGR